MIYICLAADRNYLEHLLVTMASVLIHADPADQFEFTILSDGSLGPQQIEPLRKIRNFKFELVNAAELVEQHLSISEHQTWAVAAYYRLLLPFICTSKDRILYLDCDIIVRHSLRPLWDTPMGDCCIAGVADVGFSHQERLSNQGIHIEGDYFNSGVTLWNLARIRQVDYRARLDKVFEQLPAPTFADQCWLNIIFDKDKLLLPIQWNVMSHLFSETFAASAAAADIKDALKDPMICHFTNIKPWTMTYNEHSYWFEYWQCLKQTPYRSKVWKGYVKKLFLSSNDGVVFRLVRPVVKKMLGSA